MEYQRTRLSSGQVDGFSFSALGTSLAILEAEGGKSAGREFVDLATGSRVSFSASERRNRVSTPDTPTGAAPLCQPVVRRTRSASTDGSDRYRQLQAAQAVGRWTLRRWDKPAFPPTGTAPKSTSSLTLQRCGSHHEVTLSKANFDSPMLTARYAAWADGRGLHVRVFRTGKTEARPLPRLASGLHYELSGTQRRVVVSAPGTNRRVRVFTL